MAATSEIDWEARVIEAAMALFARQGYRATSLKDVAAEAGCDLSVLRRYVREPVGLVGLLEARIDAEVLAQADAYGDDEGVRDRLFDLIMQRFDGFRPYRDGLARAAEGLRADPCALARHAPAGFCRLAGYLKAVGVSTRGPFGRLRVKGLAAVWLYSLRAFLEDDSEDLGKTMAALDKALAQAEKAESLLPFPSVS